MRFAADIASFNNYFCSCLSKGFEAHFFNPVVEHFNKPLVKYSQLQGWGCTTCPQWGLVTLLAFLPSLTFFPIVCLLTLLELVNDCFSGCFSKPFGANLIDHFIKPFKRHLVNQAKCMEGVPLPGISSTISSKISTHIS